MAGPVITSTDGTFSISIPAGESGPFEVVAAGGSYTDEETNEAVTLTESDEITGISPIGSTEVAVTPITDALAFAVKDAIANEGLTPNKAITNAIANAADFYGFDPAADLPLDSQKIEKKSEVLHKTQQGQKKHKAVLGGVSTIINTIKKTLSTSTSKALKAVSKDLSDGVMDGKGYSGAKNGVNIISELSAVNMNNVPKLDSAANQYANNRGIKLDTPVAFSTPQTGGFTTYNTALENNCTGCIITVEQLARALFKLPETTDLKNNNPGALILNWTDPYDKQYWDMVGSKFHAGIDFRSKQGSSAGLHTIYAVIDGDVLTAENGTGVGTVAIYNKNKDATLIYLHLDSTNLIAGGSVKTGDSIGKTGNKGGVAPHLHIEVRKGKKERAVAKASCGNQLCTKEQIQELTYNPLLILTLKSDDGTTTTTGTTTTVSTNYKFVTKWGSRGTGDGQFFGNNMKIAVDSSGNIYVNDGYWRIQKFDSNGTFITKWGSQGTGDGQFSSPGGVAVDSSGNVYVLDGPDEIGSPAKNRIQKFSSDGTFITKWYAAEGRLGKGITIDSSGIIYLLESDVHAHGIWKYDSNGTFISKWSGSTHAGSDSSQVNSGDGKFGYIEAIAVDSSGNMFILDSYNSVVQKLSPDFTFITKWGSNGSGDGQFAMPVSAGVDSSGNVYVAEGGFLGWSHTGTNYRIQKFSQTPTTGGTTTGTTTTTTETTTTGTTTTTTGTTTTTSAWTMLKLPDTGQTTSYTTTFGEDHDYTINPPSYTDNGNGTITDNVTGLIWQKEDDNTPRTWSDAGTYCDNLTLGGQSDWRLPSKKELISIVNYGTYNHAINTTYFPNTNSSYYWSSTTVANYSSDAWSVNFSYGYVDGYGKSSSYYVRCIRGGQ
ncbi:MAG: DUF1566 domain-containing protein [Nitrospinae bacterium]|nr:DUF1566 domain-containing protein [Nitrospinota bacterium]